MFFYFSTVGTGVVGSRTTVMPKKCIFLKTYDIIDQKGHESSVVLVFVIFMDQVFAKTRQNHTALMVKISKNIKSPNFLEKCP